jgi:hypothetical protein
MTNPTFVISTIDDPIEAKATRDQIERGERNLAWLAEHWADFLPQARGKFLAVAGQEGHVAETIAEAWAWTTRVHPEDNGALVQYVRPNQGPRIYANQRCLA